MPLPPVVEFTVPGALALAHNLILCDIDTLTTELTGGAGRNDWLLLVGAGASAPQPARLPTFDGLAEASFTHLGWTVERDDEGQKRSVYRQDDRFPSFPWPAVSPEVLFGVLREVHTRFETALIEQLDLAFSPTSIHHAAAAVIDANGVVWTTNVDKGIERALRDTPGWTRTARQPTEDGSLQSLGATAARTLVKFHGSVDYPDTLAFTDRELLTPLPDSDVNHLAEFARDRCLVVYGYAAADADLANLFDAAFPRAAAIIWYEPTEDNRERIAGAFPDADIEFRPELSSIANSFDATEKAFRKHAIEAGYLPAGFRPWDEPRDLAPAMDLGNPPAIAHARLVERFGPAGHERQALSRARRDDLRHGRFDAARQHLRWTVRRSLYQGHIVPAALWAAAKGRRVLLSPRVRRLQFARKAGDFAITRRCARLLPQGRWSELADLTSYSIERRRTDEGRSDPIDFYYRAYAHRYEFEPNAAAEDAATALVGLADVRDPERLAGAILESGTAAIYQGRFRDAQRHAFDLRFRRGRFAIPRWRSWGGWLHAVAACHLGDPQGAEDAVDAAWGRFEDEQYWQALADLETVRLLAYRVRLAYDSKDDTSPTSRYDEHRTPRQRDDLDLILGDLALARDDIVDAQRHYERVITRPSCPVAAAMGQLGIAEVARRTGDSDGSVDQFLRSAERSHRRGAHWLTVQALLGVSATDPDRAQDLWRRHGDEMPSVLAQKNLTDHALGEPRILWTVTS